MHSLLYLELGRVRAAEHSHHRTPWAEPRAPRWLRRSLRPRAASDRHASTPTDATARFA